MRCVKPADVCEHGTVNPETGHCQEGSCEEGFTGEDCDKEIKCVNGTLNPHTGHCRTCDTGFIGEDCDMAVANINGQIWMTKNMDVTVGTDGSELTCYANITDDPDFVEHYGCLYTWEDAMKVCPDGWHLPTQGEFEALLNYVSTERTTSDSDFLALAAPVSWRLSDATVFGNDEFGFSALPSGYRNLQSYFVKFQAEAAFWTKTSFVQTVGSMTSLTRTSALLRRKMKNITGGTRKRGSQASVCRKRIESVLPVTMPIVAALSISCPMEPP